MKTYSQGDIITISGFSYRFLVVSNNAFIRAAGVFHVCPIIPDMEAGPVHIKVVGRIKEQGTVICEQMKLIDPAVRSCRKVDSVPYNMIMEVSDVLQGIFEYD